MLELKLESFFKKDKCKICGLCLSECPLLKLPKDKAVEEKKKLIQNEKSFVLTKCKSCFSCDAICPENAHPYGLILFRWFERAQKSKIPLRAKNALPLQEKNFLYFAERSYSKSEKELVKKWEENSRRDLSSEKEVLFAGCNARIFPYLLDNSLVKNLTIFGGDALCCAEVYYRMGLFEKVARQAKILEEHYKTIKPKKVIMFCMAGYNMMTNILPLQFRANFNTEFVYLGEWLWERVQNGKIKPSKRLNIKIAIQDSCHSKVLGDKFMDYPRLLVKATGAELVELEKCKIEGICCGVADGITRFNPVDMLLGGLRQWRLAKKTKADAFLAYCGTCFLMLAMARKFYPFGPKLYHLLELLSLSAGEELKSLNAKRTGKIMRGVVFSSIPNILTGKRFLPE